MCVPFALFMVALLSSVVSTDGVSRQLADSFKVTVPPEHGTASWPDSLSARTSRSFGKMGSNPGVRMGVPHLHHLGVLSSFQQGP